MPVEYGGRKEIDAIEAIIETFTSGSLFQQTFVNYQKSFC